ncbi:MAG: acyl-CoA carboxylase subunit epsilon [Microbacterium sp.]|uniref:acyl-CoA carboxylase subunit epsilon n=1 Tax=Microbacterium sp. TaxID=51671 RepID=UPI003A8C00E7
MSDDLSIEVRRGDPDDDELAALIAVVTEAYAAEAASATADDSKPATPWSRTQRPLRQPVRRDVAWGRYIG